VIIARNQSQAAIFSLSREGEVTAYAVSAPHKYEWNSLYGGGLNTGSYVRTLPAIQVPDEAIGYLYNYPNPAVDHTTIRFSLRESGTVKLRFYNTAGDLVLESTADAVAGTDTEHLVDTSRLASGVYFCQLETNSGDRKHCSIAVLK
jgi:hypothetical protein